LIEGVGSSSSDGRVRKNRKVASNRNMSTLSARVWQIKSAFVVGLAQRIAVDVVAKVDFGVDKISKPTERTISLRERSM
jgi:hypothetical protein